MKDRQLLHGPNKVYKTWYGVVNGEKVLDYGPFEDWMDAQAVIGDLLNQFEKLGITEFDLNIFQRQELVREFTGWKIVPAAAKEEA